MEELKLSKLKNIFNKNSLKAIILGTAMATATIPLFTSCKPTVGGNEKQEQHFVDEEQGGEEHGGEEHGGEEQGGEEQGGEEQGGNEEQEQHFGGEPYDQAVGNGNYILHNFIGDEILNTSGLERAVNTTNHYLGKAETYVKGLANDFETSLNNRPAAKAYFDSFNTAIKNDNEFQLDENYPDTGFDSAIDPIILGSEQFFTDMIMNLDYRSQRQTFELCYRILANESKKLGLGDARQAQWQPMRDYNDEKNLMIEFGQTNRIFENNNINIENEYDANNFRGITNLLDNYLLPIIVENMNTKQNLNLQVNDLRQLINISLTTYSLNSFENYVAGQLRHDYCTTATNYIVGAIQSAILAAQQQNNQSMGL